MRWQILIGMALSAGVLGGQTVHLKTRDLEGSAVRIGTQPVSAKHWNQSATHYLVQFGTPINDDTRAALALQGAVITGTVPDNAAIVVAGPDFATGDLDVVFVQEMVSADKISPVAGTHGNDSAFVVQFHSDVDMTAARALIQSEGLTTVDHPDLAAADLLVTGNLADAQRLAAWDEVAYVFPAAPEMIAGERFHTCTGALSAGVAVQQYVRVGHGWSPDAAGRVNLGYNFGALTAKVPDSTVQAEIIRAMNEWTKVARVQFAPATSATAPRTIAIKFATRDHGDGFPFDGPNGVLAHTFYPSNPEPMAGDLHMDGDEGWHAGTNIDVYTVALHELGHALGLGHSDQPGAIMYPYYRFPSQIGVDDIAGIQSIYGAPLPGSMTPVNGPASAPTSTASTTPVFTVTVLSPAASGSLPANTTGVNVTGTTANGTGPISISWQTDHGASGRATGSAPWSAAAIPTPVGSTTITITALDAQHHTATHSITLVRTAPAAQSTTPPVLTIAAPIGTTVQTTQTTIAVSGTATDAGDVARVTWQNGNFGAGTATGTKSWSIPSIPLLVGNNNLVIRAYDSAGNSSWRSLTVVRR